MLNKPITEPDIALAILIAILLMCVIAIALFGAYLWAKSHDMRVQKNQDGSILINAIKARDHASIPLEVQPKIIGIDMAGDVDRQCWHRINKDGGFDHLDIPPLFQPQVDIFKSKNTGVQP